MWLGTGSKILAGVTIEDGAVIAAGAIVKSDVNKCHFGSINNILEKILENRVSNDI